MATYSVFVLYLPCFLRFLYFSAGLERDLTTEGSRAPISDEPIPTLSWPPETFDPASGDEDSLMGLAGSKATTSSMYLTLVLRL